MTKTRSRARNGGMTCKRDVDKTDVVDRARQQLARECPCAYYFKDIHLEFNHGVLTVRGTVPTYALRLLLETILSHVDGVAGLDNQVNVINSRGLSTVRPKSLR
jgi:hypothetical protein